MSIDDVYQQTDWIPLAGFMEALNVYVGALSVGRFVDKVDVRGREDLMHPSNTSTVCAPYVSHCWIPTRLAHSNHGLVVLVECQGNISFD